MKKLEKIKTLILRLDKKLSRLKNYGFYRKSTGSASGFIFVNPKLRIVVKRPFIVNKKVSIPKRAIPTVTILDKDDVRYRFSQPRIFIQPQICMRGRKKKWRAEEVIESSGHKGKDVKPANVGWYRGKAVLIDW